MQFVYTNYVYINTRDIKGNLMFAFGPYIPTYSCCSNPFGATMANPRINFALGVAAATSMPVYRPCLPVFGYGFNCYSNYNPFLNTGAYLGITVPAYYNLNNFGLFNTTYPSFNQLNVANVNPSGNPFLASNINSINNLNTGSLFGNLNGIEERFPNLFKPQTTQSSSSTTTTSSESEVETDNTVHTDGIKLNRNNDDYGPEFLAKVKEIAKRLNCDYRDLLGLMNSESGIRADIKNPNGSASGLIQFIESTANSLGTTTAELRAMDPIDQLDYVEKYLTRVKAQAGLTGKLSAGDLYSLVFLPGRASRDVLTSSGENYYAHNKGLDLNHDGQITKAELSQRIYDKRVSDNSFLA